MRNDEILLPLAVDAQRLFVSLRGEPVVENTGAAAQRDRAVFLRRPDETESWREVKFVADVILHFMTHAVAERQVFAHAIIVLHVPAKLILAILHRRIADALRVLRR